MYSTVHDSVDALADRPPMQKSTVWSTGTFGGLVRVDLDNLAVEASTAIQHCDELSRSVPALRSLDIQRDVLHLQARIGGLARQIADAKETLERMQQRTDTALPQDVNSSFLYHKSKPISQKRR